MSMNDDGTKLCLSKYFFSFQNIRKAAEDYSYIVKIQIIEDKDYFICNFSRPICSVSTIMKEFENYLIGLERCDNDY